MTTDNVKILCHYGGIFDNNAMDGSTIYKGGAVRSILFSRNGNYEQLKTHISKVSPESMEIKYAIDNRQGNRIYVDVHDDGDVSCMLFENALVEVFVSNSTIEQNIASRLAVEIEHYTIVPDEVSQSAPQFQCSTDAPSSSTRYSRETDMPMVVVDVDSDFATKSDGHPDDDDIQRIDCDQVPLHKGQDFVDVNECRSFLTEYAIKRNFIMKVVKSDHKRVTAKCSKENCTWRVHCSLICNTNFFRVKTLLDKHTYGGPLGRGHQPIARAKWVSSKIKGRLQDEPKLKPKDIISDIRREHGVSLTYRQAWHGKESAVRELQGSYEASFSDLPMYLFRLRTTNPGTVTYVQTDNCNRFEQVFVAFNASIQGFISGCRSFIGLDGTFLKGKFLGIMLVAVGLDANGQIFPLAFAVVEKENYSGWLWFLRNLKDTLDYADINGEHNRLTIISDRQKGLLDAIPYVFPNCYQGFCMRHLVNGEHNRLTIISDRQKGLLDAIPDVFPNCYQGFCMRHLVANFRKQWKCRLLKRLFWRAARALTVDQFDDVMAKIQTANQAAYDWITNVPAYYWATTYFGGQRYGHLTSNIAESFNSWIEDIRDKPIVTLIDGVRMKTMNKFHEQKTKAEKCTGVLSPNAQAELQKERAKSRFLNTLIPASDMQFEIHADRVYAVNLHAFICSCNFWQSTGITCSHAIAAINHMHLDPSEFCNKYFRADKFRAAFTVGFNPLPDNWTIPLPQEDSRVVLPPITHRPGGRPQVKRIESEHVDKVPYKCTRCGGFGHNMRSCKEPLP